MDQPLRACGVPRKKFGTFGRFRNRSPVRASSNPPLGSGSLALAREALASAEQHGFAGATIWPRTPLGLARAELGQAAEGVALLRQALVGITERGTLFE